MKIEAGFSQPITGAGGDLQPQVSKRHGFESVLRKTCGEGNKPKTGGICEVGRSSDVTGKEEVAVIRAEKVLDMLDIYREKLSDVKMPLDDIRPLIGDIEKAAGHLDRALGPLETGTVADEITRAISALAHRHIRQYHGNAFFRD